MKTVQMILMGIQTFILCILRYLLYIRMLDDMFNVCPLFSSQSFNRKLLRILNYLLGVHHPVEQHIK